MPFFGPVQGEQGSKTYGSWRLLRTSLVALAAIALLGAAACFSASRLIGLPSVQAAAARQLSQVLRGHITWDSLEVRLVPSPRIVLDGVAIDLPGRASARVAQVRAHTSLIPLILGRVELSSLELTRPSIRIDISSSLTDQGSTETNPLAAYRSRLGPVLEAVHRAAPAAELDVTEGELTLQGAAVPDFQLHGLSLRAQTGASGIDLETSATSNFWKQARLSARVEFADLSGHASLAIADGSPQEWLDRVSRGDPIGVSIPQVDLHAQIRTDGRTAFEIDVHLDAASMQIVRAGQRLQLSESRLNAAVRLRAREGEVDLEDLRLGALMPAGRGQLRWSMDAGTPQASLDIPRLDVRVWRDAAHLLFAGNRYVDRFATPILGGALTNLRLRAEAPTWHELFSVRRLGASAILSDASLRAPGSGQDPIALAGRIELSSGKIGLVDATARLGASELTEANVRVSMRDGAVSGDTAFDLQLLRALAIASDLIPQEERYALNGIESPSGRLRGRVNFASGSEDWHAALDLAQSNASFHVRSVPWNVLLQAGHAVFSPGLARASGVDGAVGSSTFSGVGGVFAFGSELRVRGGSGHASLALGEIYPWIRSKSQAAKLLRDIDSITGSAQITLNDLSGDLRSPATLVYDVEVQPEQVRIEARQLPGPLRIAGGAGRITADKIDLDRVGMSSRDARGLLSGTVDDVRGNHPQVTASLGEATIGYELAHWICEHLGVPAELEPKTPLHLAVERMIWNPGGRAVDVQLRTWFEDGPELAVDVRHEPGLLDLRSVRIHDRFSDATLGFRLQGGIVHANFSGSIFAASLIAMKKGAGEFRGQVVGNLRFIFDREHPERSTGDGELKVEACDLQTLLHEPVQIDRLDFSANGSVMQIREAVVRWSGQTATFRGEVQRGSRAMIVNGELDSPGVVIDALLRGREAGLPEPADTEAKPSEANISWFSPGIWPLPIIGQIRLRSDFIDFQHYHVAPVAAVLILEDEEVQLRLHDTSFCGVSFPLTLVAKPGGFTASARIRTKERQLTYASLCASGERLFITGAFDLRADLITRGTSLVEGVDNLAGDIHFESRDGQIRKFALVGNILAMMDVVGAFGRHLSQLGADGFPYRTLTFDAHFSGGRIIIDDSDLDSSAFGLAAVGSVGLFDRNTQLTALIAPFSSFNNFVRGLPLLGEVLGGSLTTIPADVTGDILDPTVIPLSPQVVASRVYGLLRRMIAVPGRLLSPFESKTEAVPAVPEH